MRYSRQTLLDLIGKQGQKKLGRSKIVIVGCGATGSVTAELLVRAGIGHITIIDRDFVELSNLQRQFLFTEADVGKPKATTAADYLRKINSKIKIKGMIADLDHKNAKLLASDIVLDCTDNFETRFLINDYCKKHGIKWIYAAVIRNLGTVFNVIPNKACFSCVFSRHASLETCDTVGVLNAAVTATSSVQTVEAIKILLGKAYESDLMRINVWQPQILKLKVNKNPNCPACKGRYEYLSGKKASKVVKLCGTNTYQIRGKAISLKLLVKKLKKHKTKVKNFEYCVHFNNVTIFKDGRAIIKANSPEKAKSIYSRIIG